MLQKHGHESFLSGACQTNPNRMFSSSRAHRPAGKRFAALVAFSHGCGCGGMLETSLLHQRNSVC